MTKHRYVVVGGERLALEFISVEWACCVCGNTLNGLAYKDDGRMAHCSPHCVAVSRKYEESQVVPDLLAALLRLPTCTRPDCGCAYCSTRDAITKAKGEK